MKRLVATTGFILGSIVGSFIVFNAATLIVVNTVRGAVLLLPAIFDSQDFRFLFHFAAVAIAGAIAYGAIWVMVWLGKRSISPARVHSVLLVLSVGLFAAIGLNLLSIVFLNDMNAMLLSAPSFADAMDELTSSFWVAILLSYLYQPLSLATFATALVYLDGHTEGGDGRVVAGLGLFVPPAVLLVWLVAQGVTGGLF